MDVLMPQLGETVTEGKISTWYKSVGDSVKPGDNLFEIETDKVSMEVPSITSGVITEIRVGKGETAAVGAIVAVIGDSAGATASAQTAPVHAAPATAPAKPAAAAKVADTVATFQPTKTNGMMDPYREVRTPERNYGAARQGGVLVTPLARRLAVENGIDLSRVKGSGP